MKGALVAGLNPRKGSHHVSSSHRCRQKQLRSDRPPTFLHDLVGDGLAQGALREVTRILKAGGILSIVEFKKQDGPPGPPRRVRLGLEDVTRLLMPFGLIRFSAVVDLGPDLWFAEFKPAPKI